jgi:HSP20 family protein
MPVSLFRKDKGTEITPAVPRSPSSPRSHGEVFFDDFDSIFDDFRRSFDSLMRPYFPAEFLPALRPENGLVQYAPLDLIDEGDHYRVSVELPGMTREDVEVNITSGRLSIVAQKEEKSEKTEKNYLHRERYYSSSRREIAFPEEVTPDKAEGTMKDGILELKIPKREPRPRDTTHKVDIR